MKLRIIENGDKFVIQRKRWFGEWQVLTAKAEWRWSFFDTSDWEFYHHKFETLQDAESFVAKREKIGREVWVAFRPEDAKVVRTYED